MPNTPVIVKNGVSVYSSGTCVEPEDKQALDSLLNSIGVGIEMQEHYMDIMTALTGCGPTYVKKCNILNCIYYVKEFSVFRENKSFEHSKHCVEVYLVL